MEVESPIETQPLVTLRLAEEDELLEEEEEEETPPSNVKEEQIEYLEIDGPLVYEDSSDEPLSNFAKDGYVIHINYFINCMMIWHS